MRQIIFRQIIIVFLICFGMHVNSFGQSYFGGGFSINTSSVNSGFGPQAKAAVGIAENLELNGMFTYYLKKNTQYSVDIDLHYKLLNISDKLFINPFAGINFTRTTFTDNSLNVGASLRFPTERMTYYLEPKYIFDFRQFLIGFGVLI